MPQAPLSPVRESPSPIPEEFSSDPASPSLSDSATTNLESSSSVPHASPSEEDEAADDNYEVVADFESDGGGEYEVLAHPSDADRVRYLPDDTMSDMCEDSLSETDSSSSTSESDEDKSHDLRQSIFASLFGPHGSSSSSSDDEDDDSSMYEEGEEENDYESYAKPTSFYYTDDELSSDGSGDEVVTYPACTISGSEATRNSEQIERHNHEREGQVQDEHSSIDAAIGPEGIAPFVVLDEDNSDIQARSLRYNSQQNDSVDHTRNTDYYNDVGVVVQIKNSSDDSSTDPQEKHTDA